MLEWTQSQPAFLSYFGIKRFPEEHPVPYGRQARAELWKEAKNGGEQQSLDKYAMQMWLVRLRRSERSALWKLYSSDTERFGDDGVPDEEDEDDEEAKKRPTTKSRRMPTPRSISTKSTQRADKKKKKLKLSESRSGPVVDDTDKTLEGLTMTVGSNTSTSVLTHRLRASDQR